MPSKYAVAVLAAVASSFGAVGARADLAPPSGALIDVAAQSSVTSTSYVQYFASFTATQSQTVVSFLFRRDPGYFGFDDASVVAHGGSNNLLVDPGFESSSANAPTPVGWGTLLQSGGGPYQGGSVQAGSGQTGVGPRSGSNEWGDGTGGSYDGIYQTILTLVGQRYDLAFWLASPTSGQAYSQTGTGIDVLAYVGSGTPGGMYVLASAPVVSDVPEPAVPGLAAIGLVLAVGLRRSRAVRGLGFGPVLAPS